MDDYLVGTIFFNFAMRKRKSYVLATSHKENRI